MTDETNTITRSSIEFSMRDRIRKQIERLDDATLLPIDRVNEANALRSMMDAWSTAIAASRDE